MIRLRHTDEWVGLLVVASVLVFLAAVLEAGVLRTWFRPPAHLQIVLPPSGVGGLAPGAEVQVLGTHAGTIRRVVLNPNQQIYAEADVDRQAEPFIRRDSTAVIRRTFGVAGAAYVDISRGTGPQLDWNYAVINAATEPSPTGTLTAMLNEIHQTIIPVLADAKRTMDALATLTLGLQKGEGTIGQLLTKDTLAQEASQAAATAQQQIAGLSPAIQQLNDAAKQVDALTRVAASPEQGTPELLRRMNSLLISLQSVTRQLARAAPTLPAITHNVAGSTANLPDLLTQTQVTLAELQRLSEQLRRSWLLGGGASAPEPRRLPPSQIHP
jgi:phospholipid/cholesterol/gamma-HCH transport system substrate-binding protein